MKFYAWKNVNIFVIKHNEVHTTVKLCAAIHILYFGKHYKLLVVPKLRLIDVLSEVALMVFVKTKKQNIVTWLKFSYRILKASL